MTPPVTWYLGTDTRPPRLWLDLSPTPLKYPIMDIFVTRSTDPKSEDCIVNHVKRRKARDVFNFLSRVIIMGERNP